MIQDVNIGAFGVDGQVEEPNSYLRPQSRVIQFANDFSTPKWVKIRCAVDENYAIAPDGSMTAAFLRINDLGGNGLVRIVAPLITPLFWTMPDLITVSCFVKNNNSQAAKWELCGFKDDVPFSVETPFDFNGGSSFTNSILAGAISTRIEEHGDNWFRLFMSFRSTCRRLDILGPFFDLEGGVKVIGEGIFIWGFQFDLGNFGTEYQLPTRDYSKLFYK